MASTVHMATAEDDARHKPGPSSLSLWNESYWFSFYDPASEIGATIRLGIHANKEEANLYLLIARGREVVHSNVDMRAPVPPWEDRRLSLHGYTIEFEKPLDRFRLRYQHDWHALDLVWEGISPTYLYPYPPGTTADQVPRHIEHAGTVTGNVTIAGEAHQLDCFGHRDHSWGGERDWSKLPRWDYLSGEFGKDLWFNAVRVVVGESENAPELYLGGLWDGKAVMGLQQVKMDVQTTDGGTRQLGVDLHLTDERGREHHIIGEEVLAIAPAQFGRTWVKDGFTRYRCGDRLGYGVLEHGYIENP